jgi:HEAT repeat protein
VTSDDTDKSLRLAAIEAMAGIRPRQAAEVLIDLTDLDDDDIVEAAYEALAVAGGLSEEDPDESLL